MGAIKINALVLKSIDYDENAKIINVFSKQYGYISFYAPGVLKSISKNKYSIQTLSVSEFEIFKSRSEQRLSKLKTGVLKNDFFVIAKNYNNYVLTSLIISILEQINEISTKHKNIYSLTLLALNNISNLENSFNSYLFLLFYIVQNSIQPLRLKKCYRCNKANFEFVRFEHSQRSFVCKKCLWPDEQRQPYSFIKLLIDLEKNTFKRMLENKYNIQDLVVLHIILIDYYQNDLGFYLAGIEYIKKSSSYNLAQRIIDKYK